MKWAIFEKQVTAEYIFVKWYTKNLTCTLSFSLKEYVCALPFFAILATRLSGQKKLKYWWQVLHDWRLMDMQRVQLQSESKLYQNLLQNYYLSHLQLVLLFFKRYLIDLYWCVTKLAFMYFHNVSRQKKKSWKKKCRISYCLSWYKWYLKKVIDFKRPAVLWLRPLLSLTFFSHNPSPFHDTFSQNSAIFPKGPQAQLSPPRAQLSPLRTQLNPLRAQLSPLRA